MTSPRYTSAEEFANGMSHGIGIVLAIAGLATLIAFANLRGSALHVAACSVFGAAMILLYTTSTLYHCIQIASIKQLLRALDHSAIFVLIAGTYTPFMLVTLDGPVGWSFLGVIWTLAVAGIGLRLLLRGRLHRLIVAIYLTMGWAALAVIKPLAEHLATGGVVLLAAGGIVYTLGVPFYKWRSLPYHHAIWHGFVLTGNALHFFSVLFYVIPPPVSV